MANKDGAYGLKPVRHLSGGTVRNNSTGSYSIASGYSTSIYYGDVVQMTGTGTNIAIAEAGNADNIGVFAGCSYTDSAGSPKFSRYWPASTTATDVVAFVFDDPQIIFSGQISTLAEVDIGQLADWGTPSGNDKTGNSTTEIVAVFGTIDKALRILGLVDSPDNALGTYAKIEVIFAEHSLSGVVSGVGGI